MQTDKPGNNDRNHRPDDSRGDRGRLRTGPCPSVLWLTAGRPRSAETREQPDPLRGLLADRGLLRNSDQPSDVDQPGHRTGPAGAIRSLRRLARMLPICDIVHYRLAASESWSWLVLFQALVIRFFGKPLLVDLRDCLDGFDIENPPPLLRMILAQSSLVVVASTFAAGRLARRGLHTRAIPEALADHDFSDRQINKVQPRLLTMLPPRDEAAAARLIKAFRRIKDKYPRAEMAIVGDEQDREGCLGLFNGWTVGLVTFVSALDAGAVRRCYADADLYVSLDPEAGRRSLLKAMAAGLPVVAAAEGGLPGPVIDRYNGLTYRWNDPGELADNVVDLIEDPPLVAGLVAHARSTAAAHRWSDQSNQWLECYRRLRRSTPVALTASQPRRSASLSWSTPDSPK